MSANMNNITRATGLSIIPKEKNTMKNYLKELLQEEKKIRHISKKRLDITEGIRRRRNLIAKRKSTKEINESVNPKSTTETIWMI
jgi:hypothetical protein